MDIPPAGGGGVGMLENGYSDSRNPCKLAACLRYRPTGTNTEFLRGRGGPALEAMLKSTERCDICVSDVTDAAVVRKFRVSMAHDDGSEEKMAAIDFGQSVRDLPAVMGILLKNPVNMLVTFGAVTEGLLVSGFMTFVPKLIQNQFGLNAGVSAMLGGESRNSSFLDYSQNV